MSLVAAVQVRLATLPQVLGTGEDATLDVLIAQAEQAIARWLCFPASDAGTYTLETATYTLYVDGPHPERPEELVLPMRPIVSVTTVHRSTTRTYDASSLVSSGEYAAGAADLKRGVIVANFGTPGWLEGYRNQRVVVTAGLGASGSGQGSVVTAVALQIAYALQVRRQGPAFQTGSAGGQSFSLTEAKGIEPRAQALLRPWQLTEKQVG